MPVINGTMLNEVMGLAAMHCDCLSLDNTEVIVNEKGYAIIFLSHSYMNLFAKGHLYDFNLREGSV